MFDAVANATDDCDLIEAEWALKHCDLFVEPGAQRLINYWASWEKIKDVRTFEIFHTLLCLSFVVFF